MLRRLAALDVRRRRLAAFGLVWVIAARVVLRVARRSIARQRRLLDGLASRLPALADCTAAEASWAVTAASRRVRGTRCLAWSLALRGLLAQARIPAELRIGVGAPAPGAFVAHAWVESADGRWSWGEGVEGYNVLRPRAAGP